MIPVPVTVSQGPVSAQVAHCQRVCIRGEYPVGGDAVVQVRIGVGKHKTSAGHLRVRDGNRTLETNVIGSVEVPLRRKLPSLSEVGDWVIEAVMSVT